MLKISEQTLKLEAGQKGYRPEMPEKVYRLLDLLDQFMQVPWLSQRLVLKGGTAINLFCSEQFPRLSVDIDLNYVGTTDRSVMEKEKPELENMLLDICKRQRYVLHRNPRSHAGGKTVLVYQSLMGTKGRLEIDLNYVYRIPLWDADWRSSAAWPMSVRSRVLDIHELAAGKLHALLGREASRDLFDSHALLTDWKLDSEKIRVAFTVYAAMRQYSWQQIGVDNIIFSVSDIREKLVPVLKKTETPDMSYKAIEAWAKKLVEECKEGIKIVLPFRPHEVEFLELIRNQGIIRSDLITNDPELGGRISMHPLLHWRIKQQQAGDK